MKAISLCSFVFSLFAGAITSANPRIPDLEIRAQLVHEKVDIKISGNQAQVTGTYKFKNDSRDFVNLMIYLPVYAKEGTPEEQMRPAFKMGGEQPLVARFIKAEWEEVDGNIKSFGKLPQLEGQRVYWYLVPYLAQQPGQKEFTLNITYKQKLSNGKFIYTPLIPKQMKDHDYGSITVSADCPLSLQDSAKHDFAKEEGKLVVKPSDKRAIVVSVAKAPNKLP